MSQPVATVRVDRVGRPSITRERLHPDAIVQLVRDLDGAHHTAVAIMPDGSEERLMVAVDGSACSWGLSVRMGCSSSWLPPAVSGGKRCVLSWLAGNRLMSRLDTWWGWRPQQLWFTSGFITVNSRPWGTGSDSEQVARLAVRPVLVSVGLVAGHLLAAGSGHHFDQCVVLVEEPENVSSISTVNDHNVALGSRRPAPTRAPARRRVAQPDPGSARSQRVGYPWLIASLRGHGRLADDGQGVINNPVGLQFGLRLTAVRLRSTEYAPPG